MTERDFEILEILNKTKNIIENKKKIDIRQLELFENYRENRI